MKNEPQNGLNVYKSVVICYTLFYVESLQIGNLDRKKPNIFHSVAMCLKGLIILPYQTKMQGI